MAHPSGLVDSNRLTDRQEQVNSDRAVQLHLAASMGLIQLPYPDHRVSP
jgi:hypothetical protein